jgi:electron transfer flavoprotein beta subunit
MVGYSLRVWLHVASARPDTRGGVRPVESVERIRLVNIVVCMKETPSITAVKRFTAEINPFDEYAIEEGLRQREQHGGEVTVLCMGPATATENLRKALAIGADRGVLVTDPALEGSDAIGTARVLAAALKKLGFDLALFGSAAADSYGGVVPAAVAEFLGQPLLSFASKLEIADGRAKIERAAETGYQVAEAALPALASVIQTINVPRYPTMKGIMGAKRKPIDTFSLADLGVDAAQVGVAGSREKATSSSPVDTQRKGELYVGNDGAADRIVAFLVEQKVL